MRPETGGAALEVARQPPGQRSTVGGSASYASVAVQPELAGALRERRAEEDAPSRAPRRVDRRARPAGASAPMPARPRGRRPRGAARRFAGPARPRTRSAGRRGPAAPHEHAVARRRADGPPFTTARRSGVKTSVWTRDRNSSAEDTAAPLSRIRFASRAETRTSVSTWTSPRRPETRAEPSVEP